MSGIIEDLYYGRIRPFEALDPSTPEYMSAERTKIKREEHFLASLTPAQQSEYNRIIDAYTELSSVENVQAYTYGFQTAMRIFWESFSGDLPCPPQNSETP